MKNQSRLKETYNKQNGWLMYLVLASIFLTGCANGSANPSKFSVSQDFLDCVMLEYESRVYGDCTEDVLGMWITQNEPN